MRLTRLLVVLAVAAILAAIVAGRVRCNQRGGVYVVGVPGFECIRR